MLDMRSEENKMQGVVKITAIVPMKAHSQRVPSKNIRFFSGKPLFYWIINELKNARHVEEIYVDTDSDDLAEAVNGYFGDVKIIIRPMSLRGDLVSMNKILEHDLSQILKSEFFIQTHTTNPLLTSTTIDMAIETYFSQITCHDSLFSVSRIQTRCYSCDGAGINHNPDELIPTQELRPVYVENSNIYIFSKDSYNLEKKRIGKKPYLFEMSQYEALDIDEEEDFVNAEILHKARQTKR